METRLRVSVSVSVCVPDNFSALNSKSLCAVVSLSAHELLRCREAEDKQLFALLFLFFF